MMTKEDMVAALVAGDKRWQALLATNQPLDFSKSDLKHFNLQSRSFPRSAKFDQCEFNSIEFSDTGFTDGATFINAKFHKQAEIRPRPASRGLIDFSNAEFFGTVRMNHQSRKATFNFKNAKFHGRVIIAAGSEVGTFNFEGAQFFGAVTAHTDNKFRTITFARAQFGARGNASTISFRDAHFSRGIDFEGACFHGTADFENVTFGGSSSFRECTFHVAPNFHDSKLHQGTAFSPHDQFPRLFKDTKSSGASNAYRTLKLAMNDQHALSEELGFFLLEMRSSVPYQKWWVKPLYWLYDLVSLYGLSVKRPLAIFIVFNAVIGLLYSWLADRGWGAWDQELLSLTLYSAVPFATALRPGVSAASLFPPEVQWMVPWIVAGQAILSAALLFLVGLSLRNMFKIK